jgi:predicted DNA-binding ribbon-helix-helix protein
MISSNPRHLSSAFDPKTPKSTRSTLISRNVTIAGRRTSVRLEPDMWSGLSEICRREHKSLHELSTAVATGKSENTSLTAAIRVFVMAYFRAATTEDGHKKAGHGGYGAVLGELPITRAAIPLAAAKLSPPQPRAGNGIRRF